MAFNASHAPPQQVVARSLTVAGGLFPQTSLDIGGQFGHCFVLPMPLRLFQFGET